jgi:cell wall-associated NlpC family hydrolase
MSPDAVITEARSWLGVPFRHQGRSRSGIDCVGLPIVVCQSLGLLPPSFDVANYGRTPSGELVTRLQQHCTRINAPVPGSLLVIAWTKQAAHVAICTGETMIHAYESVGRVTEHGYRGRWVRMTHSVWALPGVAL